MAEDTRTLTATDVVIGGILANKIMRGSIWSAPLVLLTPILLAIILAPLLAPIALVWALSYLASTLPQPPQKKTHEIPTLPELNRIYQRGMEDLMSGKITQEDLLQLGKKVRKIRGCMSEGNGGV